MTEAAIEKFNDCNELLFEQSTNYIGPLRPHSMSLSSISASHLLVCGVCRLVLVVLGAGAGSG